MVSEALDRAREVLHTHRDKVEALAARLLATEVVDEDALRIILGPKVVASHGMLHPEAHQVISAHPVGADESANPGIHHTEGSLPNV